MKLYICIKTMLIILSGMSKVQLREFRKLEIASYTCKYSEIHQIDPILSLSVMYHETKLKHSSIPNRTEDIGIMQIHCPSDNSNEWCNKKNIKYIKSIEGNINTGVKLIKLAHNNCFTLYPLHDHKSHWIRHYNWNSTNYDKNILSIYKNLKRREASL